jgi:hypothetical protein
MSRRKLFHLPFRKVDADGHYERGVYASLIPDEIKVVHVSSRVEGGQPFHYVDLQFADGDVAVSAVVLNPRKLAAESVEREQAA